MPQQIHLNDKATITFSSLLVISLLLVSNPDLNVRGQGNDRFLLVIIVLNLNLRLNIVFHVKRSKCSSDRRSIRDSNLLLSFGERERK